jgi:nucleotide-binding universal stress UspA family protein
MKEPQILFATDFSTISDSALQLAGSLARQMHGRLLIVHVEEPPISYSGGQFYYGVADPLREHLREMLEQLKPAGEAVPVEHHLLTGAPGLAILDFAERQGVDLIVLSSHGRTGLARFLLGSIAEQVVRNARCPVLTYKQPSHALSQAE